MSEREIKYGEYAEGMPWKLIIPYEGSASLMFGDTCKHAVIDGNKLTLPNGVARCKNEAGYNCTELCLACLDEARASDRDEGSR